MGKIMWIKTVKCLLLICLSVPATEAADFDFYVLALSWSPDYCAANGARDTQQCRPGKNLGLVLHGLWPQNNNGYPSSCSSEKLPAAVKATFAGLYPSDALFEHEWSKHGTCSGLNPEGYLALSKRLKESVVVPARFQAPERPVRQTTSEFRRSLVAANSALSESALEIFCSDSGRFLKEIFVCFTREGRPRACSPELHNRASRSCRQPSILVRNVR